MKPVTLLAGGFGTRLKSEIDELPKFLAPINGIPFGLYLLESYSNYGAKDIILSVGYQAQLIKDMVGVSYRGINIEYSEEDEPLGTGGALMKAVDKFGLTDVVVGNGDTYFFGDLKGMEDYHDNSSVKATMLLCDPPSTTASLVSVNNRGFVRWGGGNKAYAGIAMLKEVNKTKRPEKKKYSMEEVLQEYKNILGYRSIHGFLDIGTPESFRLAAKEIKWVKL